MSGYPPPPNQPRFVPPPARVGGFAPPPPPPAAAAAGGFAPPPPPHQQQHPVGGFTAPPPPSQPTPPRVGGFVPPPPPQQQQPPMMMTQNGSGNNMQQLNQGMNNLSMQPPRPPQPGMGFGPPPPQQQQQQQQQPGTSFMPPKPGNFGGPPPPPSPGLGNAGGRSLNNAGQGSIQPPPVPVPNGAGGPQMMMMNPNPNSQVPPPFYPQQQQQSMQGPVPTGPPGMMAPPQPIPGGAAPHAVASMPGGAVVGGGAAPVQLAAMNENIDYNVVIPERLCRWTAGKLPATAAMANASKVPFGAILRPLAEEDTTLSSNGESSIPTIQPGAAGIVRCKRCRTYINAFVTWSEHGRRWRCNICAQINDCPSAYFCHLDELGLRRDRYERPELSHSVVEFVAPAEYMVRPPQEPTYFFVLDVSAAAVRSGMLASAAAAIKASLDDLPGANRTKIGFITFDNAVHYYNLSPELANPQMLVVSDLKELFVPLPDHLLVNLQESRTVVDTFLDNLPLMFVKSPVVTQSCLGPALKAAFTIMKQIGGKMSVFQSILPNLGDGALKPRDQPGLVGTPNEHKILKADSTWYKDTAVEFSRQQISVDMYIFAYQYMDLATLGELSKFTSGTMLSYVNFNANKDGPRFEAQLQKSLTQTTAFEAVMRIRCTKGMRITNFYGNFFIRGTDLLALPNCHPDSVFGFDLAYDDQSLGTSHVTVQAALLYTSSGGERRIRVLTQALPVTSLTSELVASIDTEACISLLSKQALDVMMKSSSVDNARLRLQQVCVDIIRTAKGGDRRTVSGYSVPPPGGPGSMAGGPGDHDDKPIPENLQLMPLLTLALMKNVAFRGGTDVHPDERVQSHYLLNGMWVDTTKKYVYPKFFALHQLEPNDGFAATGVDVDDPDQSRFAGRNRIRLPKSLNLSVDRLSSNGVFLLDNGIEMYMWVGRMADMNIMGSLFGVHTLDDIDPQQIAVLTSGDAFSSRFGAITQALRESDCEPYYVPPKFNIIREGDAHMEARFFWFMIEDRAAFQGGTHNYPEFLQFVNNPQASAGPSVRGPPGPGGMPPPGTMQQQKPGMPPPQQQGMGMPPPMQQPHGMGMPPPMQQPQGMSGPPSQMQQPQGMSGPPPPMQQPQGMSGPPPPMQQPHGMSGPPPMNRQVSPAPPQPITSTMAPPPQPSNRANPSGLPGRAMGGPPPQQSITPNVGTQRSAPPAMQQQAVNRGPPQLPGPPASQTTPAPPPGVSSGFGGPPPQQRLAPPQLPPPGQRPQAPSGPPQRGMPPPPPVRSGMPPPPPPR